jgi:hypothetical protein
VSELLLFNANSAIFQLYHGKNKLILNEMMLMRSLCTRTTRQQSADRHVASLGHIILIRANQSLLFLLNAACLAEKQQIPILSLRFDPIGARTHDLLHVNNYTTDTVQC